MAPALPTNVLDKFTRDPSGCWVWTGARGADGYGLVRHEGTVTRAHRLTYERLVGPIPEGLELDHLCRVTLCVNPDHLEPVTHAENMRRAKTDACRRGHPWTPETERRRPGNGQRYCLVCNRENQRRKAAPLTATMTHPPLLSSAEFCQAVGVTYRVAHYWTMTDVLLPEVCPMGSGSRRRYSAEDVLVGRAIAALAGLGAGTDVLRSVAAEVREHVAAGRCDVALWVTPDGQVCPTYEADPEAIAGWVVDLAALT